MFDHYPPLLSHLSTRPLGAPCRLGSIASATVSFHRAGGGAGRSLGRPCTHNWLWEVVGEHNGVECRGPQRNGVAQHVA
eukprot:277112-Pyramimonas_sp.AAC.1